MATSKSKEKEKDTGSKKEESKRGMAISFQCLNKALLFMFGGDVRVQKTNSQEWVFIEVQNLYADDDDDDEEHCWYCFSDRKVYDCSYNLEHALEIFRSYVQERFIERFLRKNNYSEWLEAREDDLVHESLREDSVIVKPGHDFLRDRYVQSLVDNEE